MKKAHGVVTACLPFTSCNWLPYYSSGPIALRHTLSGILPKLSIKRQFFCNDLLYHIVTKKTIAITGFPGLFHENYVPTIPDFDRLNHAAYTAEMHWHTCLL